MYLTCSLTDARMAEVVSVSGPSPLEALSPGLRTVAFSASAGCSGTGMISGGDKKHQSTLFIILECIINLYGLMKVA